MAKLRDFLSKWFDEEAAKTAPERARLAKRLAEECDDEESAGLLNKLLDQVTGKVKD